MKHFYRMHVTISPLNRADIARVLDTIGRQWNKPETVRKIAANGRFLLEASAEGYLWAGETENDFAVRMSVAIWKRVGRYVKVTVDAVYLEEMPGDSYEFGEKDYQKLIRAL